MTRPLGDHARTTRARARSRTRVRCAAAASLLLAGAGPLAAQRPAGPPLDSLLDAPPFDRATWGVLVVDDEGRDLYARNADRLFVPGSGAKLAVAAAAAVLLPPDFRVATSVYATGPLHGGVLEGDLVVYGRGDPSFSERCYGPAGEGAGCEDSWDRMHALADSIVASGVRHVRGALVGDGSYFAPPLVHPAWESYDLTWWYASPVSALSFNDNSIAVTWGPGAAVDAPAAVAFAPDLDNFEFENRSRTVPADGPRSIDFFWHPGTTSLYAEGDVPVGHRRRTEYLAYPDPSRYFVHALRVALTARGVSVAGPTTSTNDSTHYRAARQRAPLATVLGRPLPDLLFPVLNSSQNLFAEMLLRVLARERGNGGGWQGGTEAVHRFLADSVGVDSTAFHLTDGSGLATTNLVTPRGWVRLLRYLEHHPSADGFLRGMPRSGQRGSLRARFVGTPLEGRVLAKTGTLSHANTLTGFVEVTETRRLAFAVMLNNHLGSSREAIDRIDALLVELAGAVHR